MRKRLGFLFLMVTLAGSPLLHSQPLNAQGVTSGVIQGRVTTGDGVPVARAQVSVVGTENGERWQTATSASGRFYFDQVAVGGPYRVQVRAIGFAPLNQDSLFLSLGQPRTLAFVVSSIAVSLPELRVTVAADPRVGSSRTGPAQTIPEPTLTRLPVLGRDVTFAGLLSPQVARSPTGGLTFAGQSSLLNSLQVDGSNNNDLLAVLLNGSTGIPTIGNGSEARLPIEAIKELQVVSAPFDVRFGNFAGGLINAVTRSGTDRLQGSIFGYFENQDLAGATRSDELLADFSTGEAGFTLGGPLVRGRAYFFLTGDIRRTIAPREAVLIGSDTTNGADSAGVGIRYASLIRYQNILKDNYGLDAGTNIRRSNRGSGGHVFAKVTIPLGVNQRLEVSHDFMPTFFRTTSGNHFAYGSYGLSSGGFESPETGNVTRLTYAAALGPRVSNEAKLARMSDKATCSGASFPQIDASADEGFLSAGNGSGTGFGCYVNQSLWEFGYDLGIDLGAHHVTVGTHNQLSRAARTRGRERPSPRLRSSR